jgi:predicted branched-subunit amino acid permease
MGRDIGLLPRFFIAFFNTDEIFALAMAEPGKLSTSFMLGLGTTPILGWTGGTLCGALAGSVLPVNIRAALGVMLYGMFVAIVIPPARKERPVLYTLLAALTLSCLFAWVPGLKAVSPGISIVICTVAAAALCAWLFPIADEEVAE